MDASMTKLKDYIDDARFIIRYRRETSQVMKELDLHAPRAGDPAPDFTLSDTNGENQLTLSDFRRVKPVALVFGSYT
jgi:hypothetical protein